MEKIHHRGIAIAIPAYWGLFLWNLTWWTVHKFISRLQDPATSGLLHLHNLKSFYSSLTFSTPATHLLSTPQIHFRAYILASFCLECSSTKHLCGSLPYLQICKSHSPHIFPAAWHYSTCLFAYVFVPIHTGTWVQGGRIPSAVFTIESPAHRTDIAHCKYSHTATLNSGLLFLALKYLPPRERNLFKKCWMEIEEWAWKRQTEWQEPRPTCLWKMPLPIEGKIHLKASAKVYAFLGHLWHAEWHLVWTRRSMDLPKQLIPRT